MTIGIDASRANKQNRTGVEWYSYFIIQELKKIGGDDIKFVLYTNEKLKDGLAPTPPVDYNRPPSGMGGNSIWQEKILNWPPKYLWTQIRLWWELVVNPPDVLYVPAHTIPFLPISKKIKVICAVHDVGFKRFPELYKKIQFWYHNLTMKKIRNRAEVIITISEFSKREIVDLYQVDPNKIKVTYLGYDHENYKKLEQPDINILNKYKIKKPYLLFVGRLEKKKNIINIIKAFILASQKNSDLNLVLIGQAGNDYKTVAELINASGLAEKIIRPGYVPEEDLPAIINLAEIFLFPTLYEGFGLPIIQAMACGTPVITSNFDPHKEVAGGAAILCNPHDSDDLAQKIALVLKGEIGQNLIELGLTRAANFSWQKTARETLDILTKNNGTIS